MGIQDIRLTKGDHSPGTTDIYTVHMTDGSTYTISVYNGLNGTGAGDVLGISFDLVIPAEGWSEERHHCGRAAFGPGHPQVFPQRGRSL